MDWLQTLAYELGITVSSGDVWLSIGQALSFGGASLLFGIWIARRVGLLRQDTPVGETFAIGLASGLMVLAAWWAAVASGGRSSFTPVAVGFAVAIALTVARRAQPPLPVASPESETVEAADPSTAARPRLSRSATFLLACLAGAAFIAAAALLYGSTMAPRSRDGVQPVEYVDEAYYSILGRDLSTSGVETMYSPSGFSRIDGIPTQSWYHWGEVWLASAVITTFGTSPIDARYFIVLPVLLLAATTLTGTVVRRMTRTDSRGAYLIGCLACLFLAPIPLIQGPFFSSWAVGLIFGITSYGLAVVAVLLALYGFAVLGMRPATWALATFSGSTVALILPAHLVVALLALVGVGCVWALNIVHALWTARRTPVVSPVWRRALVAAGIAIAASVIWGLVTDHAVGSSGVSPGIASFNASWRDSVGLTILGAGVFFTIPIAGILLRRATLVQSNIYIGTFGLLGAGAIGWGARLADFNTFHLFYDGIAVFATPVAAIAVWLVLRHLLETHHLRVAACLVAVFVIQLELGAVTGILRLQKFGPHEYEPIPVALLTAIGGLSPDAKLAYACGPFEEVGFAGPRLLSIDAHTGRRVVPMCFEADTPTLNGGELSLQVPNVFFRWAPQEALYPDASASPSPALVTEFMKQNGIDYIYADARHPNSLVPGALLVASAGEAALLRVP